MVVSVHHLLLAVTAVCVRVCACMRACVSVDQITNVVCMYTIESLS